MFLYRIVSPANNNDMFRHLNGQVSATYRFAGHLNAGDGSHEWHWVSK